MSGTTEAFPLNIYEENLNEDTLLDLSSRSLDAVPKLEKYSLVVVYLQNNNLTTLPEDFFPSLNCLMYLDLRDNRLTDIPKTVKNHQALTHLLLQNNCITTLPNELGTVSLKVLQLYGNPLMYPPREVIGAGVAKTLAYLHNKYIDHLFAQSQSDISDGNLSQRGNDKAATPEALSYNSVIDIDKMKSSALEVQVNEKECEDSDEEYYAKIRGKCPKLDKSRHKNLPPYYQSAKYLMPLVADGKVTRDEKIKQNYFKDVAMKKRKDLLASREKILQNRKTLNQLKSWRKDYSNQQFFKDPSYRLQAKDFPYDTNPEYMTLLTREDIEKDLPDKYRRNLVRRCRPSVPRKTNNDVHLAMKIKKLFENLEAIDLNRDKMTPRTEQKVLLNEIQKITEIKQKLQELSTSNMNSVVTEI